MRHGIDQRLPVPHRGPLHQAERGTCAARARRSTLQGRRPRAARAGLSADAADRRIHEPDDGRRARAAAGLCRELVARAIEHARHAARAAARLAGVRRSGRAAAGCPTRACSMPSGSSCTAASRKARPTTIPSSSSACARPRPARPSCIRLPLTRSNAEISATVRGLADFAPKPWPMRFRELQHAAAASTSSMRACSRAR